MVNPDSAGMLPMHDPVANMVYSMRAENVKSVMADGCWLMRDPKILIVNEQEIIRKPSSTHRPLPSGQVFGFQAGLMWWINSQLQYGQKFIQFFSDKQNLVLIFNYFKLISFSL